MTDALRRRVYFISGFDPRGPVHYNRLYRDEAEKQSRINGSRISTGPRKRDGHIHRWHVDAEWRDGPAEVDYRFLAWDDVIRRRWRSGWARSMAGYLKDLSGYMLSGAFWRLARTGRGPLYAALAPLAICLVPALLAIAVWLAGGWIAGVVALALAAWTTLWLSRRFKVVWLVNIYSFCCAWGRAPLADLEARIDDMAEHVAAAERGDPAGGAMIVGHSVGALVAIALTARLLNRGVKTRLVTLGGCVPMVGLMPSAEHFRRELQALAQNPHLSWLDVASISDPLSFARVDPLEVCGIARSHPKTQTRQLAKFVHMFKPDVYAGIKRDKLRVHFQYLMAADLPTDYDYFRLTAGPKQKRGAP